VKAKTDIRRYVTYGTSLSAESSMRFWRPCGGAWVSLLRNHFDQHFPGKISLFNASRLGANSRWALNHIRRRALSHRPAVIFLEFAINDADIRNELSVAESEQNINHMIYITKELNPSCEIWLMTSHVHADRHRRARPDLAIYYEAYRRIAKRTNVGLIDLHRCWGATPPEKRYIPDGIHTSIPAAREIILPTVLSHLNL